MIHVYLHSKKCNKEKNVTNKNMIVIDAALEKFLNEEKTHDFII